MKSLDELKALRDAVVKHPKRQVLCGAAFINAVAMLEAVEKRSKAGSWTEKIRGGLATDILAILGGERDEPEEQYLREPTGHEACCGE